MLRVNLNDTKLTLRISMSAKRKAAEIAERRGLSISQVVDGLIRQAETESLTLDTLRTIVSNELRKWAAEDSVKPTTPNPHRKKSKHEPQMPFASPREISRLGS